MSARDIAIRYAEIYFNISPNKEKLKEELLFLSNFMSQDSLLKNFLSAPGLSNIEKGEVLNRALAKHFDPWFVKALTLLARNGRIINLPEIAQAYERIYSERGEIVQAELICAVPSTPKVKSQLEEKIESIYQKKIFLSEKIDSSLIGGLVLIIGNKLLDASVRGKLLRIKDVLLRQECNK